MSGSGKAILAVEDSSGVRRVLAGVIKRAGYEVIEAVDGLDALSKLTRKVGLVVADLKMPNVDGLELTKRLRCSPEFKDLPVIILTGDLDPQSRRRCEEARISGWVQKPFRPSDLMEMIQSLL